MSQTILQNIALITTILGWIGTILYHFLTVRVQGVQIKTLATALDNFRTERMEKAKELEVKDHSLDVEISALNGAFGLFKENIYRDYPQRTEINVSIKDLKDDLVGRFDSLGKRLDNTLVELVKVNKKDG